MRYQSGNHPYVMGFVIGVVVMLMFSKRSGGQEEVQVGQVGEKPLHTKLSELRDWNREGILVRRNAIPPEKLTLLKRYLQEMHEVPPTKGGLWKYFEADATNSSNRILNRIEKFTTYHKGMKALVEEPWIKGVVSDLLGGEVALFKEKVNYKLPGGGGFEPHQDMQPGWTKYAPQMVSVLLTADDNTIENGCLEVVKGAHARTGGLIGRMHVPLNETETMGLKWEYLEAHPGDIVFFDAWAPHKSAPNKGTAARRNTYLTFNLKAYGDHREAYYADKHRSLPPDADRIPGVDYSYKV
eukprot:TRINITY_DN557_c2_g1_i1.p1 TRINITY_DN557_c2_g1~~TRINITY_DN557_c2_g1_i1.p1  ORF type:complete len:297 (+),score=76.57 TRINITY_DN557_c2_g1_i1:59-949(+)